MSDIEREAQFLIERLRQFENENMDESVFREWNGHVCPSIDRLELLLQAARQAPASGEVEPVARVKSILPMDCMAVVKWKPEQNGLIPDAINRIGAPLYSHPPAKVPEEWALVPVHATADMVRRGKRAHGEEFLFSQDPDSNIQGIWKAMLAVSPTPATTPEAEWVKDVIAERKRQDEKWGGPEHDDQKSPYDFVQHIEDYAGWARVMAGMGSLDKYRRRMIQVAALAGAAVEATDRALARPTPHRSSEQ